MNIGIDARVLDRRMTGTGRYLLNLLHELPKVDSKNKYFLFINNSSLVDENFYEIINVRESFLPQKIYSSYWLNAKLPGEAKKYNLDLFFTCNIILPFVNLGKTKKVTVVHDVIHKVNSLFYPFSYRQYLNFYLPLTFKNADVTITASNHSKSDIIKYFGVPENKIEVLYTSAQPKFKPRKLDPGARTEILMKYNLPEKFLLFVGVIERRKNIEGLFAIVNKLYEKGYSIPLVMVGRPGYGFEDITELEEKHKGKVIYLNYVEDEDLHLLYNSAHLFLFPSYYEGFGIPPLEAMQSGLPVIASGTSSLPEVIGDAGVLLNPDDYDKFVDQIIKLTDETKYYNNLREKGIQRSKLFSPLKSAERLVEIFEDI